jgi:hypothetical protein
MLSRLSIHKKDRKMKKIILFLFAISLFSCKKDSFDEAPVPLDVLGSWQWVSKSGGFAGEFIKVDSTQKFILTILPNKEFIWCKNGDCSIGRWSYGTQSSNNQKSTIALMDFAKTNTPNDFPMTSVSFTPFVNNVLGLNLNDLRNNSF